MGGAGSALGGMPGMRRRTSCVEVIERDGARAARLFRKPGFVATDCAYACRSGSACGSGQNSRRLVSVFAANFDGMANRPGRSLCSDSYSRDELDHAAAGKLSENL